MPGPYLMVPTIITDAMLTSSTVPEPDTANGEAAWVSGGTYAIGNEVVDNDHNVYYCVQAHTMRTLRPKNDPFFWLFKRPTNRWGAFDTAVATPSIGATPMTIVLRPGFFNAITFYGLNGAGIVVSVKDAPGGTVIYRFPGGVGSTDVYTLQEPPLDWYDWAFGQIRVLEKLLLSDIVPYPDAELTITITAGAGNVSVGMINVGDLRDLLEGEDEGGPEQGAVAEPITYAYIDTDQWGTTVIEDGPTATNLSLRVFIPEDARDQVVAIVQSVLGKPVSFITTKEPGYDGLNAFGLLSGKISYEAGRGYFNGDLKGLI